MKIAHVVTLVDRSGSYGGPVAVARGQCEELARRGHDVTLFAGWDGAATLQSPDVSSRLFRARKVVPVSGFSALSAPAMIGALIRELPSFDVVHVHLARDLVVLPAALLTMRGRVALLVQTHGMVRPDGRRLARVIDAVATGRVLAGAAACCALTAEEARGLERLGVPAARIRQLGNGVPPQSRRAAWAEIPRIVYCARLHRRKRPVAFVEAAAEVLARGHRATFALYGPDEGELGAVDAAIHALGVSDSVSYEGPVEPARVLDVLAAAQVYVLPSVDEPFPMSLLEAMSLGLPSITTDSVGIKEQLMTSGGAIVTDASVGSLADAVVRVITDAAGWERAAQAAVTAVADHFSVARVVTELASLYGDAISEKPRR